MAHKSSINEEASAGIVARGDRRVPMSRIRARIAERLVEAQQTAAILTTFNEVDLTGVIALRKEFKDAFEKSHGVKLGFMSFFTKAAIEALKQYPLVNASLEGSEIIYHDYYDIGMAISSPRGLVVPVLRDVDAMSFADIEQKIVDLATQAKEDKLNIQDLQGGTFTITNGGVFGSMLSTPILNPPQSAILGMHTIQQRPMVVEGEIKIRSMMYLALSYDHRIIDGRDAVSFLVNIKENLENPSRMLLGL
jgi:2-oxoglutarate dehydrogenase E2 component (dihydrolipoamide succinyltransferase)